MQSARPVHENLGELSHALSRENMVLYFNNNLLKKAKPRFCLFPSICRKAHGKGEAAALCNMCALKKLNGVPENRNARSGVRFLGIRSNKSTRAWRQVTRAACPPSPCCDVLRGENRSGFPSNHGKKFYQLKTFFVNPSTHIRRVFLHIHVHVARFILQGARVNFRQQPLV